MNLYSQQYIVNAIFIFAVILLSIMMYKIGVVQGYCDGLMNERKKWNVNWSKDDNFYYNFILNHLKLSVKKGRDIQNAIKWFETVKKK